MGETHHNPHQHFFPLDGVSQQHPSEIDQKVMIELRYEGKEELTVQRRREEEGISDRKQQL